MSSWGYLNLVLVLMLTIVFGLIVVSFRSYGNSPMANYQKIIDAFDKEAHIIQMNLDRSLQQQQLKTLTNCGDIKTENSHQLAELTKQLGDWIRQIKSDINSLKGQVEELALIIDDSYIIHHKGPLRRRTVPDGKDEL